ncbi:unnamed protein product [Effrenium voratum]|uniref:Uncharacterized protein n=1 Tax=Effrenium voratum TaxID=2562239 RepID=A0AA36IA63_9DINO|nr:unnamed protein product [Effrenium voratum]
MTALLLWALLGACRAEDYPHYVPACGSCNTAQTAAEEAAKEHRSLAEQAKAAAAAGAGAAAALSLSPEYQAQYAGKAAFEVYHKAGQPLDDCAFEAAKEAARTAEAAGLDKEAQLKSGTITAALSLGSIGQSGQQRADGALHAAKALARRLYPAAEQQAAVDAMDGPISFITGVLPTGHWNPEPNLLEEPASPINELLKEKAAAEHTEVQKPAEAILDVNSASGLKASAAHGEGLPGYAWFLISFAVVLSLFGAFLLCYRKMGDSRDRMILDEGDEDDDDLE